ncbi:MAG TPA: DUF4097 family beta strand repeat-containing protein [Gammaproteobacteria bacterium]|nr:DUF4097 family beta strand repeat-containing protein [Gammaproteobacteria bacterium]
MKLFIAPFAFLVLTASAGIAHADSPVVYSHQWSLPAHTDGAVRLELDTHDVRMHVVPGDAVKVSLTIRGDADNRQELIDRYKINVSAEGNDVVIASPHRDDDDRHWFSFGNDSDALVEVALPPAMAVHFKLDTGDFRFDGEADRAPISGRTDTGDVTVHAAPQRLDLATDTGDVHVRLSQPAETVLIGVDTGDVRIEGDAKRLDVNADTGSISASGQFGDAEIRTDTGDIDITGLGGSLKASTDTGDVDARWRQVVAGARIEVVSDSGDATVTLPAGTRLSGKVVTDGGTISSDFAGDFNDDRDVLQLSGAAGATAVHIRTDSGDVELRKSE